jgi:hypothetical protein
MVRFQRNDWFRLTIKSALILTLSLLLPPASSHGKDSEAPEEKISLNVTLDKAAYRPGEAVLATVEMTNHTRREYQAGRLNAGHVIFVFGRQADPERMERQAVASEKEPLDATFTLESGKTEKRRFLLTRLTEFTGAMVLQVHYLPGGAVAEKINPKIYSNTVQYKVDGARLFVRDPEGFIAKGEALRVARGAVRGEVEAAQAIFVRDEMGFYKWYVNLKPKGAAGLVGWFVDPYTGKPWHQAKPFDPALARDPRFDRPANMPKTPVPARVPMNGK